MKEHTKIILNKNTKRNVNVTCKIVRTAQICVHNIVHYCHTQQHRAVLIIFPLILQTSTRAQMLSSGGRDNSAIELLINWLSMWLLRSCDLSWQVKRHQVVGDSTWVCTADKTDEVFSCTTASHVVFVLYTTLMYVIHCAQKICPPVYFLNNSVKN